MKIRYTTLANKRFAAPFAQKTRLSLVEMLLRGIWELSTPRLTFPGSTGGVEVATETPLVLIALVINHSGSAFLTTLRLLISTMIVRTNATRQRQATDAYDVTSPLTNIWLSKAVADSPAHHGLFSHHDQLWDSNLFLVLGNITLTSAFSVAHHWSTMLMHQQYGIY